MKKQNKQEELKKTLIAHREEIAKLKKKAKRQKWWNVWLVWIR